MQGMYELLSSFFLFTTHISYRFVLNYSCEAIKSIYVYACLHTHEKKKDFLPNVTCFEKITNECLILC